MMPLRDTLKVRGEGRQEHPGWIANHALALALQADGQRGLEGIHRGLLNVPCPSVTIAESSRQELSDCRHAGRAGRQPVARRDRLGRASKRTLFADSEPTSARDAWSRMTFSVAEEGTRRTD